MVYCGKPSKGCANCRERKIRCDQNEPACGQCIKVRKSCPGYRSQLDLAFRNESKSVEEKAKASRAKKAKPPRAQVSPPANGRKTRSVANIKDSALQTPSLSSSSSPSLVSVSIELPRLAPAERGDSASPHLPYSIAPTAREFGVSCFASSFGGPPTMPGHICSIAEISRRDGLDETVAASMTAVGLASLANRFKSSEIMSLACGQHAIALRNINEALRSTTATNDSTLLSILVISLFENVAGGVRLSLKAWTEHIKGAAALVELRGPSQLETKTGLEIFLQATSYVILSCVQQNIALPPRMRAMFDEASKYLESGNPRWLLLDLVDDFIDFRVAVKEGGLNDPEEIINTALKIEDEFVRVFEEAPRGWRYETYHESDLETSRFAYNGLFDVYTDHWTTHLRNRMRILRILLNERIRLCLLEGFNSADPRFMTEQNMARFQVCTDNLIQMVDEILRGVQKQLGSMTRTNNLLSPSTEFQPKISDVLEVHVPTFTSLPGSDHHTVPASAGYLILWPLYMAGVTRVTTPEIRDFVIKILRYIGNKIGISQGTASANFILAHKPLILDERRLASKMHEFT